MLGVIILATLVLAFLASKRWHWAHVLTVVGLVFASLGYVLLATVTLKPRLANQRKAEQNEERLVQIEKLNSALTRGTDNSGLLSQLGGREVNVPEEAEEIQSVTDLEHRIQMLNRVQGRSWINAQPQGVDQQTGQVRVGIEFPQPLGIDEGAILFAFEQGAPAPNDPASGRQYLGEFRVVAVADQIVTLEPVLNMDGREAQRLTKSSGPWQLYETMPADNYDLFSQAKSDDEIYPSLTDEQLKSLFPADVVDAYLRDGSEWKVDDGVETKEGYNADGNLVGPSEWGSAVKFLYRRQLNDYSISFQELAKDRIETLAGIQAVEQDIAKLNTSLAAAKKIQEALVQLQNKLNTDLDGSQRDLQAVEQHLAQLNAQLAKARTLLAQTLATNAALVDELASIQGGIGSGRGALDVDAL